MENFLFILLKSQTYLFFLYKFSNTNFMNLLKALSIVSGMTLISRILGFFRDLVIARVFGSGLQTDAFFVALTIPNLLRRLFAEGAFSQAFVPILGEYKAKAELAKDFSNTKILVDRTATLLAWALILVTLIGIIATPLVVFLTAPGFLSAEGGDAKYQLTINLMKITFPYIFFISLVAMAGGILNTWKKFAIPAVTPTLLNISFITMSLLAAPYFTEPIYALAWAVFIGGVLQLAIQIPALLKISMLPSINFNIFNPLRLYKSIQLALQDEGVKRILWLMFPALLGVSVSQISLILNNIFASYLQNGSVSWLYFADRLMEFPAGLLGAALGTILLPSLSEYNAKGLSEKYSELLDWGLKLTFLLAMPSALGLAILALPLISTLFFTGEFTQNSVYQTRLALWAYAAGLPALILVKVLAPGFYAKQNIKTPVKIALLTLFITQLLNVILVLGLDFQHMGLALSISLAAWVNAGFLFIKLNQHKVYINYSLTAWAIFLVKLFIALALMSVSLWLLMGDDNSWLVITQIQRGIKLFGVIIVGVFVYFTTLFILGFRLKDFKRQV